ncbi:MAG: PP2C family protein-serine/threonine phosphatase [Ignavibacteriales bacterium]|nr:PP2C family protein-serine/threonine phosphatase [Ignavibacteriales bacterium]
MKKIPLYGILFSIVVTFYVISILLAFSSKLPTLYLTLYVVGFFCNILFIELLYAPVGNEAMKDVHILSPRGKILYTVLYVLIFFLAGFLQFFVVDHGIYSHTFYPIVKVFGAILIVILLPMKLMQTRIRRRESAIIEKAKRSRSLLSLVQVSFVTDGAIGESLWTASSKRQKRTLFIVLAVGSIFPYFAFLLGVSSPNIPHWIAFLSQATGLPNFVFGVIPGVALLVLVGLPALTTISSLVLTAMETSEKEAAKAELNVARAMQFGLMPESDPVVPGLEISGSTIPANEVGGDYYDYVWLNDEKTKFGIAIADVSGKAMKAAMTAVMTSGMIYTEIGNSMSPKVILQHINRPMYLKTSKQMFTALSFAVIDTSTRILTLSNAGQMPPLLKRGNEIQYLHVTGNRLPLGVIEDSQYNEVSEQLSSGDLILFFTDGIAEAMNEKMELFGFDRIDSFVGSVQPQSSAKTITAGLLAEVQRFAGQAPQHDDMTVVAVKVN